ncbi:MAG: ATP-binding cassette domain-containing protein, partial [Pseudomonadota bacterium]
IVERLKKAGFDAHGVDADETMIAMGKKRRSLEMLRADARNLPIKAEAYGTVIISSGVIDYIEDRIKIKEMCKEALRVLRPHGHLLVFCYKIDPAVEKVYKKLGVVVGGKYYMKRLFEIQEGVEENPLGCVKMIARWTGNSYLRTFLYWSRLGIALPKKVKREDEKVRGILSLAAQNGVDPQKLVDATPEVVPYRDVEDLETLGKDIGYVFDAITECNDCLVGQLRKTKLLKTHGESNEGNWIIETKNLTKKYKKASTNAVDSLNIRVPKGSIFGILGPNGAGKTTTMSMLCGLLKQDKGTIAFSDEIDRRQIKSQIGYVPQELSLFPKLTCRENLAFFAKLYGVTGSVLKKRIEELLILIGLEDRDDDLVSTYSKGMERRLNLAVGLIHEPEIVLLDEPTVGIDPQSRNRIFEAIRGLKADGVTVLYTTHYMEEAMALCDRIAIMDGGKIILEGDPKSAVEEFGHCTLEFEARGCPEGVCGGLSKIEGVWRAEFRGGTLIVLAKPGSSAIAIAEKVIEVGKEQDAHLKFQKASEPSLESLFLELTGKRLRDTP